MEPSEVWPASADEPRLLRPLPRQALSAALPAELSSFVGRQAALRVLTAHLRDTRLLTLTGPPGVGKSRLALRLAARETARWPDGSALVELAPLAETRELPKAVATALRVPEQPGMPLLDSLVVALETRTLLLLLDNCEHLAAGIAELVATLLRACPDLAVLATSREPLGVAGETVWPVSALELPADDGPATVRASEAGQLFAARARAARPGFTLTIGNAAAVAAICRHLDGIPLALELAAARVPVLAPAELAARLDDRFRLLSAAERSGDPRHRTLQAAVDWSYALLSDAEQRLLRRLAVFAGGFTLAAAEGVCSADDLPQESILDLLTALVRRSLVVATEREGATRFGLLETLREYGLVRLAEAGEEALLRERHYAWFVAWAEAGEPNWWGGAEQVAWLWALETEWANLLQALRWSQSPVAAPDATMRLTGALWHYWEMNGHHADASEWNGLALAQSTTPSIARAHTLAAEGQRQTMCGQATLARALVEEACAIARRLDDAPLYAHILTVLATATYAAGDVATGAELNETAQALAREGNLPAALAYALHVRGSIAWMAEGDLALATRCLEEALDVQRAAGERWLATVSLAVMGCVRAAQGSATEARKLLLAALDGALLLPFSIADFAVPMGLAQVALANGQPLRAARLCGIAESITATQGLRGVGGAESAFRQLAVAGQAAVGEGAFEAARAEGRAMTREDALACMRADPAEDHAAAARHGTPPRLTRREAEVARLVGRGRSNLEIAAALSISERTVETHVTHILHKLDFQRRAQIAAWAATHLLSAPYSTADD